ncbi:hypothetical protein SDC9_212639 [bioreactor metagenome]|uniref:Uncharacterized protein n=1 Tax=bioreactor metagenome TaxID=1076179 RepID=A0A645JMK5_9ZZZZ
MGRKLIQLLGKPRLQVAGKEGVADQLGIDKIELVQRSLLAQGHHRNHHIAGMGKGIHGVQQVGLALPVLAADDHTVTLPFTGNSIEA